MVSSSSFSETALVSLTIRPTDTYWLTLNPEKVFLLRILVDHLHSLAITTPPPKVNDNTASVAPTDPNTTPKSSAEKLEALLPVVTALAFHIQNTTNELIDQMEQGGEGREEEDEDELLAAEFVVGEMLRIAARVDYGDEIGRRKMFEIVRECLPYSASSPVKLCS